MKSLGVAIIGCGAIHKVHVDGIKKNGIGHILWFVDIQEDRARVSAREYGGKWSANYHGVLKDPKVDVVHICTPHYLHSQIAIDALNAGKHVFVEKPVATSLEGAELMAKAAEKNKKNVTVCFQNRYNPTSLKAKEIIEAGELGRIMGIKGLVTWFRDSNYYIQSGWRGRFNTEGGGVLINQSIHTLDLMQWLAGQVEYVQGNVSTRTLKDIIEVEDTADATLYFKNGARGIFYATNCYTDNSSIEIEIHMEKGKLRIYDDKLIKICNGTLQQITDEKTEGTPYKSYWGEGHSILIKHFYKNLIEEKNVDLISIYEGTQSLKIIDAIYRSSSTGNKIRLEDDGIN